MRAYPELYIVHRFSSCDHTSVLLCEDDNKIKESFSNHVKIVIRDFRELENLQKFETRISSLCNL